MVKLELVNPEKEPFWSKGRGQGVREGGGEGRVEGEHTSTSERLPSQVTYTSSYQKGPSLAQEPDWSTSDHDPSFHQWCCTSWAGVPPTVALLMTTMVQPSLRDTHIVREGRTRQGCHGPHQRVCTRNLSTTSWKVKLMGRRKDRMIREKMVSKDRKNGAVEQSQNKHMRMTHDVRTTNTQLEPWATCIIVSRPLSAVNDLTATNWKNKTSWKVDTSEVVWRNGTTLFTWAQLRTFLFIVMSSTRNRSTVTKMCLMKKTMGAIAGIARKESARVALLQTLGEDGVIWSTLRWSLNDLSSVRLFQKFWERSTNSFCIEFTHLPSFFLRHSKGEIFLRVLVHLDADFFSSINAE